MWHVIFTVPEDVLDEGVCKLCPVVGEGLGEARQVGVFLGEVDDEFGKVLDGRKKVMLESSPLIRII